MKKFVAILMVAVICFTMICCSSNLNQVQKVSNLIQKSMNERGQDSQDVLATDDNTEIDVNAKFLTNAVLNIQEEITATEEPEESVEPAVEETVEIDYESLFDFSGWKADFETAENKERYLEEYWKTVAADTFYNIETYYLLKEDERAKSAFLEEVKAEMEEQMEQYLLSRKITVDDKMRGFIEEMVDMQVQNLEEIIH